MKRRNAGALFWICMFAIAIALMLVGCATTGDVPAPLVGEVKTQTVYVDVPVLCTDATKLSKRPPVHAAKVGSDGVQHMAGAKADAEDLRLYAAELEAEIVRCSKLPPKPEVK